MTLVFQILPLEMMMLLRGQKLASILKPFLLPCSIPSFPRQRHTLSYAFLLKYIIPIFRNIVLGNYFLMVLSMKLYYLTNINSYFSPRILLYIEQYTIVCGVWCFRAIVLYLGSMLLLPIFFFNRYNIPIKKKIDSSSMNISSYIL